MSSILPGSAFGRLCVAAQWTSHSGRKDHTHRFQGSHQAWHAVKSPWRRPPSPQSAQEMWGLHYWVWSDLPLMDSPDVKNCTWAGSSNIATCIPHSPRTNQEAFQSSRISGPFSSWPWEDRWAQGSLSDCRMFSMDYITIFQSHALEWGKKKAPTLAAKACWGGGWHKMRKDMLLLSCPWPWKALFCSNPGIQSWSLWNDW